METATYSQVFAYVGQIEQTGSYSKEEMEAILSARFLYDQDWLEALKTQGPTALAKLQEKKGAASTLRVRFARLAVLLHCLFSWLMGGEFDEPYRILQDVLDNLYSGEDATPPQLVRTSP